MTAIDDSRHRGSTVLGHPSALWGLSAVEMWERFSYYGMRGLLVLFLTSATVNGGFGWSDADALRLYGWYTALVYATPIVGGWLADRVLGVRRGVILGAVLMAAGHFSLAGPALVPSLFAGFSGIDVPAVLRQSGVALGELFPTPDVLAALNGHALSIGYANVEAVLESSYRLASASFYLGLVLLIVGNGLFKPNMATLIGHLYDAGDARKDSAYTIFYMAVNLGAFLANLIAGTLGEIVGWHYGFSVAGIGMTIGLFLFLKIHRNAAFSNAIRARESPRADKVSSYALTKEEASRLRVIVVLALFSILFWTAFEQGGGLLNLFAMNKVDRTLWIFEIPATWFQSLNPLFIIVLAPIFAEVWQRRARTGRDPSTAVKFALGLGFAGLAFLLMALSVFDATTDGQRVGMIWLVVAYLLITVGELALSPVGLSAVNKLAPLRFASMMMGVWFLSNAAANYLAGQVGALAGAYSDYTVFAAITVVTLAAALIAYLLSPLLVRWSAVGGPASAASPVQ